MDVFEFISQAREIIENAAVLNHHVGVLGFVELTSVIAVDGAGIHAFVDPKQGHSNAVVITIG